MTVINIFIIIKVIKDLIIDIGAAVNTTTGLTRMHLIKNQN